MVFLKKVTLVAKDGHSLPYAAVIVHTSMGEDHKRSDNAGNFRILRFFTDRVTVKDPRYVEQTWKKGEIESQLIVRRTVLGSSLDAFKEKLLQPAKGE